MGLNRIPTDKEIALLKLLAIKANRFLDFNWEQSLTVRNLDDGGMGSLALFARGVEQENRLFGECVTEHMFTDKDGVEVIASLNVDKNGELLELDIWKINFKPLISLPDID